MSRSKLVESEMTIEELKKKFEFYPETGEIFNPKSGNRLDVLHFFKNGSSSNLRYKQVQFSYKGKMVKLAAHRMIWAVVNGRWPKNDMVVDHLNSDTLDNRISNLEEITQEENVRRIRSRKKPVPNGKAPETPQS